MEPPADVRFGERLRYMREEAELTQQQLADVMRADGSKMHRSTIGKIEAGERGVSIDGAVQFAKRRHIDLRELINVGVGRRARAQREVRCPGRRAGGYG